MNPTCAESDPIPLAPLSLGERCPRLYQLGSHAARAYSQLRTFLPMAQLLLGERDEIVTDTKMAATRCLQASAVSAQAARAVCEVADRVRAELGLPSGRYP